MPRAGARGVEKAIAVHRRVARPVGEQESRACGDGGEQSQHREAPWSPGGAVGLDEVAEDPEDLLGISNDGEDPHLGTEASIIFALRACTS